MTAELFLPARYGLHLSRQADALLHRHLPVKTAGPLLGGLQVLTHHARVLLLLVDRLPSGRAEQGCDVVIAAVSKVR